LNLPKVVGATTEPEQESNLDLLNAIVRRTTRSGNASSLKTIKW